MKLSEHKNLKAEILALPQKEKDKLLLRLVARDKVLTERLHVSLLENESDLIERVAVIKNEISTISKALKQLNKVNGKDVLMNLRKLAKIIAHFEKVTKAHFEEVELRVFLGNQIPGEQILRFDATAKNNEQHFTNYVVKYTLVTIKKFEKLHEDLQFDLKADLNQLLRHIYNRNTAITAKDLAMPKEI